MSCNIAMSLSVHTRIFDENGNGEVADFHFNGVFSDGGICTLTYKNEEDDAVETLLSYEKDYPDTVCMKQRGALHSETVFSPGKTYASLYEIPGVGEMDMRTVTRRVENTLSPQGGKLTLDYEMYIGGARRRTVLTLAAEVAICS